MLKTVEHERIVRIHITRLPEGVYLPTSDDIQGLVGQGRTVAETPVIPLTSAACWRSWNDESLAS